MIYMHISSPSMTRRFFNSTTLVRRTIMEYERPIEDWKELLIPALESKVEELHLMNYQQANIENVWACLKEKVWKETSHKRLYEVTQDIFHLSGSVFMGYLTVNAYTDDSDLMSSIKAVMNEN